MCNAYTPDGYSASIRGDWVYLYAPPTPAYGHVEVLSMPVEEAVRLWKQILKHHAAEKRRKAFVDPGMA